MKDRADDPGRFEPEIETSASGRAEPVLIGGSYWMPSEFEANIREPSLPDCWMLIRVERGRVKCVDLRCTRRLGGAQITGELLRRIPVAQLMRDAVSQVAVTNEWDADGNFIGKPVEASGSAADVAAVLRAAGPIERGSRRGARVSDEHLKLVAALYREAVAEGLPPTKRVAEKLFASRSTAGRWVQMARQRGFLGAAMDRRAGEIPDEVDEEKLEEAADGQGHKDDPEVNP